LNRSFIDLVRPAKNFGLPQLLGIRIDFSVQRMEQGIHQRRASLDRQP